MVLLFLVLLGLSRAGGVNQNGVAKEWAALSAPLSCPLHCSIGQRPGSYMPTCRVLSSSCLLTPCLEEWQEAVATTESILRKGCGEPCVKVGRAHFSTRPGGAT